MECEVSPLTITKPLPMDILNDCQTEQKSATQEEKRQESQWAEQT